MTHHSSIWRTHLAHTVVEKHVYDTAYRYMCPNILGHTVYYLFRRMFKIEAVDDDDDDDD
jgi:hypothetical protein